MDNTLRISKNGRYFERGGRPFFWLGDTAWLLFEKLTLPEAATYLQNRAAKGFTVVQATLVHKHAMQNAAGSPALLEDDFLRPNPDEQADAYWPHVRQVVEAAAALGLMVALLPSWGSLVSDGTLTLDQCGAYTDFLARHFGGYGNVLWLVGGDVRGDSALAVFDAIGEGLRAKCPDQRIGYHPFGRCSSSTWFHDRAWLDFNMFQSGHRDYAQRQLGAWDDQICDEEWMGEDSYRYVLRDRARLPAKPTLDGEPSYELIPHGLHDSSKPYWQACDVRRYAYWSLLAGAAGHTYGDNAIMQFYTGQGTRSYGALQTWDVALHNPGSMQMGHARRVMEAIAWHQGEPYQALLAENDGEAYAHLRAMRTPYAACCYAYEGQAIHVNLDTLEQAAVDAWWFDPVVGGISYIGRMTAQGTHAFTPPDRRADQNDALLVLVDPQHAEAFIRKLQPA